MLQPINDQDSGYGEIIEPPPSLWRLVEDQVPMSERAEFKRILGDAAVDLSLDLHTEIEVLLELWREIRSTSPSSFQSPPSSCSILADPPVIKEMVTQEIRMLLLSVRSKARHQGLDEDQALSKYNSKVVSYVMGPGQPESRARSREGGWSRPQSASRGGNERPVSALSTGSSIEDDLEELRDKLKISDIDEVVRHLQSLLEDECQTLKKDIAFLQQRLEEESLYGEDLQMLLPEPSLTELKEERRILEKDLQLDQLSVTPLYSAKRGSARSTASARLLDVARRESVAKQDSRVTPQRPRSCVLHQRELPRVTPCPPHTKLKASAKKEEDALAITVAAEVCPPAGHVPGLDHCHKTDNISGIAKTSERLTLTYSTSCNSDSSNKGTTMNFLPADSRQIRTTAVSSNTPYIPAPPSAQRTYSGGHSVSAFRRLKTQVPTTPP
ncbi:coiled-coil domain-containing protein 24 [Hyperolius riggenbachi]|uniref:coiled-coil domain-containing protein 24 n=1 Tax=Hyperolius riggenbachi TaxID=752182 RepID=UPI0035A279AD